MELWQLQCFLTVAEELNFSRAAIRLKITQPPLSLQIKQLEKELGIPLFFRNNRHVELSEAGKVFYSDIRQIFDDLNRAAENAQRAHRGEVGTLTVGFVGSATYDILPAVLREFRNLYPLVQVLLHEMSTPTQIEALHQKRIDVGVLRPPVTDDGVCTEIVMTVPCVLAVPKNHPLIDRKKISLEILSKYPFVMLSRKTWASLYDEILARCNPTISQEALEFQTVIGLVAAGLGIAIVPQSAINLHTQDVAYLDLHNQLPMASMGISWRKGDHSPLVKAFLQIAKSTSAN
ncbi:LysR substrate-binding domain-containing protein [Fodinisporobacter ferrooxydans]|uniref:LysR substrate-binding domain-containing protein n=1 Tax=Fodinisporobacter ferrooxydans TaxID=2901836 RepID=A0ABY4CPX7_9BACL|nr:LysR substrate-binding domain-containing protein [Alicyclobacillaceae bacterium MYW30-H2]